MYLNYILKLYLLFIEIMKILIIIELHSEHDIVLIS
jgi:hypothetical protein